MGSVRPLLVFIIIVWAVVFTGISLYLSRNVKVLSEQLSEKSTTLVGKLIDSTTTILAVRLFARRKYEIKFLESIAKEKVQKAEELG